MCRRLFDCLQKPVYSIIVTIHQHKFVLKAPVFRTLAFQVHQRIICMFRWRTRINFDPCSDDRCWPFFLAQESKECRRVFAISLPLSSFV